MADIIAFEIQIYQGGAWKIDSVFDDRELAVFEARRLNDAGRYSGVRVVEETFTESTGMSKVRIIYRGSKVDEYAPEPVKKQEPKETGAGPTSAGAPANTFKKTGRRRPQKNGGGETVFQVIQFIGIALVIAGFIYFLQYLKENI